MAKPLRSRMCAGTVRRWRAHSWGGANSEGRTLTIRTTSSSGNVARLLIVLLSTLLVGVIQAAPASTAVANEAATVPTVPEPIAAVAMYCAPNGIDINSATIESLQQLPDISEPVARRIVAARPFLRPDPDLLLVSGIGPDKLALIVAQGRACAEPTLLPPPAFDVCRSGDGRIDLNRPESRSQLAKLLGSPTAQRISDGIPYWSLGHVRAEGEAGSGDGKMEKFRSKMCLTPPTIDHRGVRWGWNDRGKGGQTNFGGASLLVPGGVLDPPAVGAWSSIQPADVDQVVNGPTFDMTVHAPWADGQDKVLVILPQDSRPDVQESSDWTPTILHDVGANEEVHALGAVSVQNDGRLMAKVSHLTRLESLAQPTSNLAFIAPVIVLPKTQVTDLNIERKISGAGSSDECSPDMSSNIKVSVESHPDQLLTGIRPVLRKPAAWCVQGNPQDPTATFKFSNTTGLSYRVSEYGSDFAADAVDVTYGPDVKFFTERGLERTNAQLRPGENPHGVAYGAGSTIHYSTPRTDNSSEIRLDYDVPLTAAVILTDALGLIPGLHEIPEFVECIDHIADGALTVFTVVDCAKQVASRIAGGNAAATRILARVSRALNVYQLSRTLVESVGGVMQVLGLTEIDGSVYFKLGRHLQPPVQGGGGGAAGVPSGVLVRNSSGNSFFLNTSTSPPTSHKIRDGGTYVCFGLTYPVVWNTDIEHFVHQPGEEAACPVNAPVRDLNPGNLTATSLLREVDGDLWLAHPGGGRDRVPSEAEFNCFSNPDFPAYLTWDFVSTAEVEAYPWTSESTVFQCGSGF